MPPRVLDILVENLEVDRSDTYQLRGPMALSRLRYLWAVDRPELKDPPFVAATPSHSSRKSRGGIYSPPFATGIFFCIIPSTRSSR